MGQESYAHSVAKPLCELRLRAKINDDAHQEQDGLDCYETPNPGLEGEPDAFPVLYPLQFFPMLRQRLLYLLVRPLNELLLVFKEFAMNAFDRLNRLVVELNGELLSFEFFQEFSNVV